MVPDRARGARAVPSASSAARGRRPLPIALLAVTAAVLVVAVWLVSGHSSRQSAGRALTPLQAVNSFLRRYMGPDGRVVRTDQGGDTVSEGQAYAMLMAAATGQQAQFDLAWGWAQAHLQRPDGLLAWRWQAGSVVGSEPASDADLGAAAALVMASRRFSDPGLLAAARRIAMSILAEEVVPGPGGPVLVAGPWAEGGVAYVDPSYLDPLEIGQLASAFGASWTAMASSSAAQLESLTAGGALPPDWAVLGASGTLQPSSPPGQPGTAPSFGFDAVRAPIWMAGSCSVGLRRAAAGLLPALQRGGGRVGLDLRGLPSPGESSPVGLLAEAAGEYASGSTSSAEQLVGRADTEVQGQPSYYSSALIALTVLAFHQDLDPCG